MADRVPPSREDTLVAISRWVGREPEVAYDLHPDLRVILNAARGWSSGRLVDHEAIDYEALAQVLNAWGAFYVGEIDYPFGDVDAPHALVDAALGVV